MDFVLDSSDSDYINSPRTLKIPPQTKTTKVGNGKLYFGDVKSITKNELQAVYDKLDTPKAMNRTGDAPKDTQRSKSSFDVSRERMKLANIIDSETNNDDTDTPFLRPITMQAPLEKGQPFKSRNTTDSDKDSFELRLDEFSDTEDLLAEFSRNVPTKKDDTESRKMVSMPDKIEESLGKLLQIESNSEQATPKLKSIKDELAQSKTRFRQSINELLNSSPISAASLERAPGDFKELIKLGSKLSEQLLIEVETSEKIQKPTRDVPRTSNTSAETITKSHRMSIDGLKPPYIGNDAKTSIQLISTSLETKHEKHKDTTRSSGTGTFMRRLFWALFMLFFFVLADLMIQVMVTRQEAGLSLVDLDFLFHDKLDQYYQDLAWWLSSKFGVQPFVTH